MRDNKSGNVLLYALTVLLTVGLAVLVFFNYELNAEQQKEAEIAEIAASVTPTPEPTATPSPTPEPVRNTETITIAFSGDIIGQAGLTTDAEVKEETTDDNGQTVETVTHDYAAMLAGAADGIYAADAAACTLVSTLSEDTTYDSYCMDGSFADALKATGYDLVNLATDHILDFGLDGLTDTVGILSERSLAAVGAAGSELSDGIFLADINGVKVAFLSYTYGTGGNSAASYPWCVDILTTDYMSEQSEVDYERIESDIAVAREQNADIIVCFVYWWDNAQYYTQPRDEQNEVVDTLLADGVDIFIGGGIKVPQPMELRTVERSDGTKANCAVCYSLSSLMSCYNDTYTALSATALVEISRDTDTDDVWVSGLKYEPMFMLDTDDYDGYEEPDFKYRVLDAYAAAADYEEGGTTLTEAAYDALMTGIEDMQALFGEEYDISAGGVQIGYPY